MGHILLVEDDGLVQRILGDELEYLGHEISSATTPHEAIGLISSSPSVDLVVTDVEFGLDVDGVYLARWITIAHPQIQVIGISGNPGAGRRLRSVSPDILFLAKPFSVEELMAQIESRLETGYAI